MFKYLVLALAIASSPCFALTYQLPTSFQVTGHYCGGEVPVQSSVTGFDPTTSTYTGFAYAVARCSAGGRGAGISYWAGCDEVVWDSTGALVSYSRLWLTSGRTYLPASSCLGN